MCDYWIKGDAVPVVMEWVLRVCVLDYVFVYILDCVFIDGVRSEGLVLDLDYVGKK